MSRIYRVAFWTLVRKETRRFLRIWPQTLLPSAITMTLYFMIFGQLIGQRIGEMDGLDYMQFIMPGLVMMAVITNSYTNVVSSFFSSKFQRSVEEILVSPMPGWIILWGYVLGGVGRGLLVGILVLVIGLFFTEIRVAHWFITLAIVTLTAVLFSLGGFINALFANKFDDIAIVPTFVLTPLTYLGGVFYSIDLLPDFWRSLSLFNPILYMVNTFRYGLLGVTDINPWIALGSISVLILVLWYVALWMLEQGKGLRY